MADVSTLKKDYQTVVDKHSPKNEVLKNYRRIYLYRVFRT